MLLAKGSKQFKAEAYPRMVLALTSVAEVDGATVSLLVVLCFELL
jgi:anti-anti-sigma regulatory factor